MTPLEERIGYKFRNALLLAEALTHPSLGYENQRHHFDNQRLEFLGDAVLQLIFTRHLYDTYPKQDEGDLTRRRARLVSRDALRRYAGSIQLGDFLMMGKGEETTGGRHRASVLADAFEALVGAMYLDGGIDVVARFIETELQHERDQLVAGEPLHINPKGRLQEILQGINPTVPRYDIIEESGPEHAKTFKAVVIWEGRDLGTGNGSSKKEAENMAALDALKQKAWIQKAADDPTGQSAETENSTPTEDNQN